MVRKPQRPAAPSEPYQAEGIEGFADAFNTPGSKPNDQHQGPEAPERAMESKLDPDGPHHDAILSG
jgi:hypothetical protein